MVSILEEAADLMESRVCDNSDVRLKPIGYLESWFKSKNGTPRQPSICAEAKAKLTISKSIFTRPDHSLEGLEQFSHIWIVFLFHENKKPFSKAKVAPPRLNGKRVGVFSTRSPHRPNPIGLTLATLVEIKGSTLFLTGIDILDGTPVLDIKPYIPEYDRPKHPKDVNDLRRFDLKDVTAVSPDALRDSIVLSDLQDANNSAACARLESAMSRKVRCDPVVKVADWIGSPPVSKLLVRFTPSSEEQLARFGKDVLDPLFRLEFLTDVEQVRKAIVDILAADPRSVYRRSQCQDRLYYFTIDRLHLTCWFDDDENCVEVVKIKPV